jgi:energy-converting hydrogenase Eha subunit A
MTENSSAFLLIIFVVGTSSILWHFFVKRYSNALIGSIIMSVLILQIISYIEIGHLDSFFMISIFTTGIFALVVSSIIGQIFEKYRKATED